VRDKKQVSAIPPDARKKGRTMSINDEEVVKLFSAILGVGRTAHNTPSGEFLDVLRALASQSKLREMSEACKMYFSTHRESSSFVTSKIPPILMSHYFKELNSNEKFQKWITKDQHWADEVRSSILNPGRFEMTVNGIVSRFSRQK